MYHLEGISTSFFGDWYNGSTPALGAEGESSTLSSPTSFTGRGLAWCATCLGDK